MKIAPMAWPAHDSGNIAPEFSSAGVLESAKAQLQAYRSLVDRTVDVFGDEIKASIWLSSPSPDFKGKPPIQVAQEANFAPDAMQNLFEPVFVRIEEGIYA